MNKNIKKIKTKYCRCLKLTKNIWNNILHKCYGNCWHLHLGVSAWVQCSIVIKVINYVIDYKEQVIVIVSNYLIMKQ